MSAQMHSAGKTTIGEMKRDLAAGKVAEAQIPVRHKPGGGKPSDSLIGDGTGTGEPPVLVDNPPAGSVIAPAIVKGIVSRIKPAAAAIAAVTTLAQRRDYGYVLSHVPFGASITKTLEAIGE